MEMARWKVVLSAVTTWDDVRHTHRNEVTVLAYFVGGAKRLAEMHTIKHHPDQTWKVESCTRLRPGVPRVVESNYSVVSAPIKRLKQPLLALAMVTAATQKD